MIKLFERSKRFNPRACMRRDIRRGLKNRYNFWFQSTRLHEARPFSIKKKFFQQCFNPRACMRRDAGVKRNEDFLLFQSTRLHEARLPAHILSTFAVQFQSTRLHEARRLQELFRAAICLFQSTRLHEARPQLKRCCFTNHVSIHAPA